MTKHEPIDKMSIDFLAELCSLLNSQERLGKDFEAVWDENVDELYNSEK